MRKDQRKVSVGEGGEVDLGKDGRRSGEGWREEPLVGSERSLCSEERGGPRNHPLLQQNYTGVETTYVWKTAFLLLLAETKVRMTVPRSCPFVLVKLRPWAQFAQNLSNGHCPW